MKTKKLMSVFLSLTLVLSMTACSTKPNNTPPVQNKEDFTLNVGISFGGPAHLDPARGTFLVEFSLIDCLFEGLMLYKSKEGATAGVECGQAASYSISEDKLTYTFVLRDDIQWSDGKPVVASDFAYAWQRLVDPATNSKYASLIKMVENANEILAGEKNPIELGVKALDEKTFEVKLAYKCPYFLDICALAATFPVRKDIVETNGELWYRNPKAMICNGAYTLSNWELDDKMLLAKNEKYYDALQIGPDHLAFTMVGDTIQAMSLFSNNQFDLLINVDKQVTSIMKDTKQLVQFPLTGLSMIYFNNQNYPFTDPKVRRAFSLAIDRNLLVGDQGGEDGLPLAAFVPNGVTDRSSGNDFRKDKEGYFSVAPKDYAANCDEAKRLLAEAGFANGENFPTVRFLYTNIELDKRNAEILTKCWEDVLGIKVENNALVLPDCRRETSNGNYDIVINSWIADYNDPTTFLDLMESTNPFNSLGYNSKAYDAALQAATDATTTEERFANLHKAEDILFEDSAIAPLYSMYKSNLIQENITGYEFLPLQTFTLKYAKRK